MTNALPFQTRARTIDHLGREQIADVPTAVSELWKNAYDAYATQVALHIFDGPPPIAAIFDDGHGMTYDQFIEKWLVVGTDSKAGNKPVPTELRKGLLERPKQGQKGIGRLSVAALGSSVLVISKQENNPFVISLVDWRLFENPYLFLQDVRIPVLETEDISDLEKKYQEMTHQILENLTGELGPPDRTKRIKSAWEIFDNLEEENEDIRLLTSCSIQQAAAIPKELGKLLVDWPVFNGESLSGTAMLMFDINASLKTWLPETEANDENESIRASLIRTLSGFSDPYTETSKESLDYKVVVHAHGDKKIVLQQDEQFGIDFLRSLEHVVEGDFDSHGVFRGTIRAFGKNFGAIEIVPGLPPPSSPKDRVGPFSISIGAFEGETSSSTHPPDIYAKIDERGDSHGGLYLYRDRLRVMPYGRPENDFFKIEERRTSKAGREFWSSRKLFGRIVISRAQNSNLRDKAGREGLIDNAASRALQMLVIDLLKTTARRYFGGESTIRKELLPAIQAENSSAAKKAKAAGNSQLRIFKSAVTERSSALNAALIALEKTETALTDAISKQDSVALWGLQKEIDELISARSELQLPPKPKKLGRFEATYRDYRDRYGSLAERISDVRTAWTSSSERLRAKPPIDVAKSRLGSNQKLLTDRLAKWNRGITDMLKSEIVRVENAIENNRKEYYKAVAPLLDDVEHERTPLSTVLAEMDDVREQLDDQFRSSYEPYFRSILQLSEGIDLDSALGYTGDRNETLEKKVEQIQGLAQIGISVEILNHELETLDRRLASSLAGLPPSVRVTNEFAQADRARRELVERLRFLSQMQISSGDVKQELSGHDIAMYLHAFFDSILVNRGITLSISVEFNEARFHEYPSRIYPVFINLINNSIYWMSKSERREIRLSTLGDSIIVSDTGPGIDEEDIPSLFELFFTKRVRGRGVGLYLCKQTLASGGHEIYYAKESDERILPGANFIIKLRNGFYA